MRRSIKAGIEIEAIMNNDLIPESLRRIQLPKGWRLTGDGSLSGRGEYDNYQCVEFISNIVIGKNRFKKRLEQFKTFIINQSGTEDLKEVLNFNTSCGCHIHMGLTHSKDIGKMLSIELINEFRKRFFKGLDKLKVKKKLKDNIKQHYFRKYSKRTTTKRFKPFPRDRYIEINRVSERENTGLEWRAFNILGCDNWHDFTEVIMYAYGCFEWLLKKRMNGYTQKRQYVKIPNPLKEKDNQDLQINNNKLNETIEINL